MYKDIHISNKPIRFVLQMAKPQAHLGIFASLAVILGAGLGAWQPYLFSRIIDSTTEAINQGINLDTTWMWVGLYIVTILIVTLSWRVSGLIALYYSTEAEANGFRKLFEHLSFHSYTYFSNRFAGSISSKIQRAAGGVDGMIEFYLWTFLSTLVSTTISASLIFFVNVWLGVVFVGMLLVIIAINYPLAQYRRPFVVQASEESSKLSGQAVDFASNIGAVWQFARRQFELLNLSKQVDVQRKAEMKQWQINEISALLNGMLLVVVETFIIVVMLVLLGRGTVTLGEFIMVLGVLASSGHSLIHIGQSMNRFVGLYGRIEEGLSEVLKPHDIIDEDDASDLVAERGEVEFRNVIFGFQEDDIFNDFSLTIPDGQRVGVVGQSGAGKTTLVNLLLRYLDIQKGEILIDGQDISKVTQDSLRRSIAVVPQEPILFHRSIYDNIHYGDIEKTKEDVEHSAKLARAHDFILDAPKGYETLVGERGIKLSGGQRQRIAIARAMLKDSPILILDEATSALDSESEVLIQKALRELMEARTVLAIAHRLSTLREMDRIIVLDQGKIVQDGTHEELSSQDGLYKTLWEHQAGGFLQE